MESHFDIVRMVVAIAVAVITMAMTMMLVLARHIADSVDLESFPSSLSARRQTLLVKQVNTINELSQTHMFKGRILDMSRIPSCFPRDRLYQSETASRSRLKASESVPYVRNARECLPLVEGSDVVRQDARH